MTRRAEASGEGAYHPDATGTIGRKEYGDLIGSLYDWQDRLYGRLNRKMTRPGQRIAALEERGRE